MAMESTQPAHNIVTSIDGLYRAVETAKAMLQARAERAGLTSEPEPEFWFRGVPRQEFKLVPSLFRIPVAPEVELALYESYVEHRAEVRDWQALFEMQHHFIHGMEIAIGP